MCCDKKAWLCKNKIFMFVLLFFFVAQVVPWWLDLLGAGYMSSAAQVVSVLTLFRQTGVQLVGGTSCVYFHHHARLEFLVQRAIFSQKG